MNVTTQLRGVLDHAQRVPRVEPPVDRAVAEGDELAASPHGPSPPAAARMPSCRPTSARPRRAARRRGGLPSRAARSLLGREPPLGDTHVEQLVVLPLPRPVDRHRDVELEVLRVVAAAVPPERLLEVHVPAAEGALRRRTRRPRSRTPRRGAAASGRRCPPSAPCRPTGAVRPRSATRRAGSRTARRSGCTSRAARRCPARRAPGTGTSSGRRSAPRGGGRRRPQTTCQSRGRPSGPQCSGGRQSSQPVGHGLASITRSPSARISVRLALASRCRARPPRRARPRPSSATRRPG